MSRTSKGLLLAGLAVAALGTLQFLLVLWLSNDPNPNPAINGVLMWFSWALGALLILAAVVAGMVARVGRRSD